MVKYDSDVDISFLHFYSSFSSKRETLSALEGAGAKVGQVDLEGFRVADRVEVGVVLCLLGGEAVLVVVSEQLIEEIDGLVGDESLVVRVDKRVPGLLGEAAEDVVVLGVKLNLVLVEVLKELVSAEHLGNLDQLVGVTLAVEERLLAEDHGREHGTQRPHVQTVVVLLEVDQQLRALEVARCHAHIVLGRRVVELSQAPVDQAQLSVFVVDHNVVRLDITMHNALAMAKVQRFQQLQNVESHVEIVELGVKAAEVGVVDVLKDERRRLALRGHTAR